MNQQLQTKVLGKGLQIRRLNYGPSKKSYFASTDAGLPCKKGSKTQKTHQERQTDIKIAWSILQDTQKSIDNKRVQLVEKLAALGIEHASDLQYCEDLELKNLSLCLRNIPTRQFLNAALAEK